MGDDVDEETPAEELLRHLSELAVLRDDLEQLADGDYEALSARIGELEVTLQDWLPIFYVRRLCAACCVKRASVARSTQHALGPLLVRESLSDTMQAVLQSHGLPTEQGC